MLNICTNIRSLGWTVTAEDPFAEASLDPREFQVLVRPTSLVLGEALLTDAMLVAVGRHGANLRALRIYCDGDQQQCRYTSRGLAAVAPAEPACA